MAMAEHFHTGQGETLLRSLIISRPDRIEIKQREINWKIQVKYKRYAERELR